MDYFVFNISTLLAAIFLLSGVTKISGVADFEFTLMMIKIPHHRKAARVFIGFEIIVGLLLIFNSYIAVAAAIASIIFIMVTIRSKSLNINVNCNCFGSLSKDKLGYQTMIRACVMLILSLIVLIYSGDGILSFNWESSLLAIINAFAILITYLVLDNGIKFLKLFKV